MVRLQRTVSNSSTAKSEDEYKGANEIVSLATLDRLPILSIYTSMGDFGAIRRIVRGRRSEVFTVICRRSLGHMAIKKYNLGRDSGKVPLLVRLKREICNMDACANVPFVTKLFGHFREGRGYFLAIELFPLGDLDTIRKMQPGRKLPETYVAICIIRPLLIALNGMHEKGIVHGNVVPESVFVKSKNIAYLGDFSCSANLEADEQFLPGLTPVEYSPPEVVMAIPQLSKQVPAAVQREVYGGRHKNGELKVDIWAIGCMAYELLVGYSPFSEGPNPAPGPARDYVQKALELGMNILTRDVSTLYFPASISMEARDFIQSCLKVGAIDRPTADELLDHDWFLVQAEFELESHHTVIFPQSSQPTGFSQGKYRSSQIRKVSEALRRSTFAAGKRASEGFMRFSGFGGRFSRMSSAFRSSMTDQSDTETYGIERDDAPKVGGARRVRQSIDDVEAAATKKQKEEEKAAAGKVTFGRIMSIKKAKEGSGPETPRGGVAASARPLPGNEGSKSRLAETTRSVDPVKPALKKPGGGMFKKMFSKKGDSKVTPSEGEGGRGGGETLAGPKLRLAGTQDSSGSSNPAPKKTPSGPLNPLSPPPGMPMKGPLHNLKMLEGATGGGGDSSTHGGASSSASPRLNNQPAQFKDLLKQAPSNSRGVIGSIPSQYSRSQQERSEATPLLSVSQQAFAMNTASEPVQTSVTQHTVPARAAARTVSPVDPSTALSFSSSLHNPSTMQNPVSSLAAIPQSPTAPVPGQVPVQPRPLVDAASAASTSHPTSPLAGNRDDSLRLPGGGALGSEASTLHFDHVHGDRRGSQDQRLSVQLPEDAPVRLQLGVDTANNSERPSGTAVVPVVNLKDLKELL